MPSFIDHNGERQQIALDSTLYRQANDAGLSAEQFINLNHPTQAGSPAAFEQMCESEGLIAGRDRRFNLRPATMRAIVDGPQYAAGVVRDAVPASRILFPAFVMSAIESSLRSSDYGVVAQFEGAAAVVDSINDEKFERPILSYTQPEAARSRAIAQNSEPASMLSITASDQSRRITATSIGMEISDQALRSTSLDLVTLAMRRQFETEMVEKIEAMQLAFLNGDKDVDMAALSTVSGSTATAASFDSTIVAAGVLTQKAWVKFLFNHSRKRRVTHVITDIDGFLAIQNRTGRPVVTGDNGASPRMNTNEVIVNKMIADEVQVFITQDANWPANSILAFEKDYGYHVVNSTYLDYQSAENYAIRRSTKYRVDSGSIAYRLFDDAWSVLTLTV